MAHYQITVTRVHKTTEVATTEIDIPSDDAEFVRRYAETMMHPDMRYRPGGINPRFRHVSDAGDDEMLVSVTILAPDLDADFAEVALPPMAPPSIAAERADDEPF